MNTQTATVPSAWVGRHAPLARRLLAGACATLVIATAAHVAFVLPFTPVPFTLQPLAVLSVGLVFGPADAFFALLAYLAEGALGLPVFAPTGPGGMAQLLGPTGGFLLAYPFVALLASSITRAAQRRLGSFFAAFAACSLAVALLFANGTVWLATETHLGLHAAWRAAVLPFLPGELIKVLAAAGGYRALRPTSSKLSPRSTAVASRLDLL